MPSVAFWLLTSWPLFSHGLLRLDDDDEQCVVSADVLMSQYVSKHSVVKIGREYQLFLEIFFCQRSLLSSLYSSKRSSTVHKTKSEWQAIMNNLLFSMAYLTSRDCNLLLLYCKLAFFDINFSISFINSDKNMVKRCLTLIQIFNYQSGRKVIFVQE